MKSIKYLLWSLALVAGGVFTACTEDDTYTPGTPDNENCAGVYFPEQKNTSGSLLFSPEDEMAITYTVARSKTTGGVTVPVKVEGDASVFTVSPINFADGQSETTFTVSFDTMTEGQEASLKMSFDDPNGDYVSNYTTKDMVNISILIAGWLDVDPENVITYGGKEYVGYCEYTDDLLTTFYGVGNQTYPIKVQVRSDTYNPSTLAGLYRMVNPYGEIYPYNDPGDYWDEDCYVLINATNPKKVYIEPQYLGFNWGEEDGEYMVWSYAHYYCRNAATEASAAPYYGKIENGSITFPERSLLFAGANYEGGAFYVANRSGAFKLVIDHTLAVEYDLTFDDGNSVDGKKNITVDFKGKDVAKVKYGIYAGSLKSSEVNEYADEIDADKDAPELTESGTLTVELEETGVYTLVAVVYDANDDAVDVDSYEFTFVAAGEEADHAVVLTMGVDPVSDRYLPQGYTSENAGTFWAYGKDIEWAVWDIYDSKTFNKLTEDDVIESLTAKDSDATYFTATELADLNKDGISFIVGGELLSGTNYTVAVYAFNGYTKTLFTTQFLTAGESPEPLKRNWVADDMYGISKKELFKSWYMWGVDFFDGDGTREPLSVVTFSESDNDFEDGGDEYDMININGLSCGIVADDTHEWEYYKGFIMNFYTHENLGTWGEYYINYVPFVGSGTYYGAFYDEMFVGGLVDDGYMAVAFSEMYNLGSSPTPDGFLFNAYTDEACKNSAGNLLAIYNIMFEDPAVSELSATASYNVKKGMPKVQFNTVVKDIMSVPANYVEKRGRERAHAIIDEMNAGKKAVKSVSKTTKAADMPKAHRVDAKVTYTPGVAVKVFDKSLKADTGKAVAKL